MGGPHTVVFEVSHYASDAFLINTERRFPSFVLVIRTVDGRTAVATKVGEPYMKQVPLPHARMTGVDKNIVIKRPSYIIVAWIHGITTRSNVAKNVILAAKKNSDTLTSQLEDPISIIQKLYQFPGFTKGHVVVWMVFIWPGEGELLCIELAAWLVWPKERCSTFNLR